MTYTVECSLEDFPAWSGGLVRLNELRAKNKCKEVEQFLEECNCGEPMSDTDINDYLWFDVEQDFPQYFKEDEEDEEDEEED